MINLSVVLATRNEESNIGRCLDAVKDIADEIIIFDEGSTDKTLSIVKQYGAKVYSVTHESNFHITKQKAIEAAKGEWILQLDADEVVTKMLREEIMQVIHMTNDDIRKRKPSNEHDAKLFERHLTLLEHRDGRFGNGNNEVVAFFIPRINMFLGSPLIHGGVYPDGVIRLIKNGYARLPAKSVHEQMEVDGDVAWLFNPLEHWDSPTLHRYIYRLNRYTDLHAQELKDRNVSTSFISLLRFVTYEPFKAFVVRYVLRGGYKDGLYGFAWALFSAWHYPLAYFKYVTE